MSRLAKRLNSCEDCEGKGSVVVDHVAWLSGDNVREKDIWDCCPECEGTGLNKEDTHVE